MDETAAGTTRSRTPPADEFGADPYAPSSGGPAPDDEAGLDDRSHGSPEEFAQRCRALADADRRPLGRPNVDEGRRATAAIGGVADTFRRLGLATDGRAPFDIPDLFRELSRHVEQLTAIVEALLPPEDPHDGCGCDADTRKARP
jgi:hypothetical protein